MPYMDKLHDFLRLHVIHEESLAPASQNSDIEMGQTAPYNPKTTLTSSPISGLQKM